MDSGPLVYYPGSHKLDRGDDGRCDREPRPPGGDYEDVRRAGDRARGAGAEDGTIRKGQALIWASNLLHGGAPQATAALTR